MKADWETGLHMAKVGGFVQRNPSGDTSILRPQRRYINDAHQFFMKFSYLWRF